ncbi:MAG: hypothetical protein HY286_06675 [Planctomycetes bacterium]|nr:hypothetical protein [Planctomycetota bacterium]
MQTNDRFSLGALEFFPIRERLSSLCETDLGRTCAGSLAPAPVAGTSREWLARVAEAAKLYAMGKAPSLSGIEDFGPFLHHLSSGGRPLEPLALAKIASTLRRGHDLRILILQNGAEAPKLASVASALPDLVELAQEIDRCVDIRGEVLDTASAKLAVAAARRRGLESEVDRVMLQILARPDVRKSLNSPKPVYRNNRPVLAVKSEFRHRVSGLLLDRSGTGGSVFIEPEEVVELGNALAEVAVVIAREISTVLLDLSRLVLARRDRLVVFLELAGELDLEFTKARYLIRIDGCIPQITDRRKLRITDARHPGLLDYLFVDDPKHHKSPGAHSHVVPIDVEIGGEYDLLVVTGPNTGGKTVALKTVGLLAAMALSGIPIPARGAEIPAFDGIFVDIGDEQEISQSLSTFSSHMIRVAAAVRNATRESLVLMDEVGAGTDPAEGAALGEAILEYFLSRGVRAMATTHLGSLKELAYRHKRIENATVEFDPETLQPRFRLLVGIPGSSQALAVAQRVGMPEAVVANAASRLEKRDHRTEEAVVAIQSARVEADAARRRADSVLLSAEQKLAEAAVREQQVEMRSAILSAEAQKTIDAAIGRLRMLMKDRFDRTISTLPKPFDSRLRELREELESCISLEPIEQKRLEFVSRLKRDDIVYIPKLKQRCPVRKVQRDRRIVTVMLGDVPTDVRYDEVTWYEVL